MQSELTHPFPRRKILLGILALTLVVLAAYFFVLNVSFVGDDWIFYELAGRLSLAEYLGKYFDPNAQTAWYRPVQGLLFRLGYDVFGTDQMPYHLVQVLFHLANAILLFAIIGERTGKWLVGFIAAVLFATIPLPSEAIFKAGVIDPVTAFFSLISLWFWLRYLENESRKDYAIAFAAFAAALLSKEIAVLFPVTLFLFDRLAVAKRARWTTLIRRYAPYVVVLGLYAPIEYIVTRRSVFVSREGYQPGLNLLSNLIAYLAGLAFPWGYQAILSTAWLVVAAGILVYLIVIKKRLALVPVIAGMLFAILPVAAFPVPAFRFLYLSLAGSAFLFALAIIWVLDRWRRWRSIRYALLVIVAGFVIIGGYGLWRATADFGEFARVSRVPFRNFRQAHPTLQPDTLVYFVNPPIPGTNLSGMLFWYYGKNVTALADDSAYPAGLREHAAAFVSYFDEAGDQKELRVDRNATALANLSAPLTFAAPIRLDGWELVNNSATKNEPFILLLYWRGTAPMETDYIVSVDLVDSSNKVVQNWSKSPKRGLAPTSSWRPGEMVVDAVQIAATGQAGAGPLRLELSLYDPGTLHRVPIQGAGTDALVIQPLSLVP